VAGDRGHAWSQRLRQRTVPLPGVPRTAGTAWRREWRRLARFTGPRPGVKHGLASTYRNYNCRCEPCREAALAFQRAYRARKRTARERQQA
jgi:hypothetical protein